MNASAEYRLAVVGGGFCGTLAIVNLIRQLNSKIANGQQIRKPIRVFWFDAGNTFARGLPYGRQGATGREVFILNQPAYAMSPLSDDPECYSRWLQKYFAGFGACSFTSRELYGTFLEELIEEHESLVKDNALPICIEKIAADVVDLEHCSEGYRVITSEKADTLHCPSCCVQDVILAIGHQRRDLFSKFAHNPAYVKDPFYLESYVNALQAVPAAQDVILIGGGPTTVDAVRALEFLNYQGCYTIVTSQDALPWSFDPQLYLDRPIGSYTFKFLLPENVTAPLTYVKLAQLLQAELRHARANDFGEGHIYYGLKVDLLFTVQQQVDAEVKRFLKDLNYRKGAVTAPENCTIYQRLKKENRIRHVISRVSEADAIYDVQREHFEIQVHSQILQERSITGEILVNGSITQKALGEPFLSEFLSRLLAKCWIALTQDGLIAAANQSDCATLYVLGPHAQPANGGKRTVWGVEAFRDEIRAVIQEVIKRSYV